MNNQENVEVQTIQENEYEKEEKAKVKSDEKRKEIIEFIESLCMAVAIAMFVALYIFRLSTVSGSSMEQTLYTGETIAVSTVFYNVKAGDIIIAEKEINNVNELIVKRVIATEGQSVDINADTHEVIVDGVVLDEPYVWNDTDFAYNEIPMEFPLVVGENEYFVLGDNRQTSLDSRYERVGLIKQYELFGEVLFRLTPFNKIGIVK